MPGKFGFELGLTCTYTPTSTYVTFGKAPGVGSSFEYDVIQSSTSMPMDIRLVRSIASVSSQFLLTSTSYINVTSSFQGSTTKKAYCFALQARQSTNSTDFTGTVQVRWMCVNNCN